VHQDAKAREFFRRRPTPIFTGLPQYILDVEYGHAKDISERIVEASTQQRNSTRSKSSTTNFKSVIQQRLVARRTITLDRGDTAAAKARDRLYLRTTDRNTRFPIEVDALHCRRRSLSRMLESAAAGAAPKEWRHMDHRHQKSGEMIAADASIMNPFGPGGDYSRDYRTWRTAERPPYKMAIKYRRVHRYRDRSRVEFPSEGQATPRFIQALRITRKRFHYTTPSGCIAEVHAACSENGRVDACPSTHLTGCRGLEVDRSRQADHISCRRLVCTADHECNRRAGRT